ncbi:hypothetical protein Tco_0935243 [Tanacetum coccineum]
MEGKRDVTIVDKNGIILLIASIGSSPLLKTGTVRPESKAGNSRFNLASSVRHPLSSELFSLTGSTLQRLPFYCTPPAAADAIISDPSPKDLAASHVAKRIRSALAQSSGSTTRHSLFVGDSDDESDGDDVDACVKILLVTSVGI